MKARHKHLCEHSLDMALAAIEIYNKPNFVNREQVFCILVVNAWESLLKAKLLKDHRNKVSSLFIKEGKTYKKNKDGRYITIGISQAAELCPISQIVKDNLDTLIEIRNAATHLTAKSSSLPVLVFTLGSANLRNYAKLIKLWFNINVSEYNFHILPMGFSYPFKSFTAAQVRKEPEDIAQILRDVTARQILEAEAGGFFFVCELQTTLISAKKITSDTDLVAKIEASADAAIVVKRVNPIDLYPYTYTEAWKKVREHVPELKQSDLNQFIREQTIKGNSQYSTYHYRNKQEERRGPSRGTTIIYNDDFIRLCIDFFAK